MKSLVRGTNFGVKPLSRFHFCFLICILFAVINFTGMRSMFTSSGKESYFSRMTRLLSKKVNPQISAPAIYYKPGLGTTGIGNQLFAYACAYSLSRKHNWPLYIHVPKNKRRNFGPLDREFVLDHFNIPLDDNQTVTDSYNLSNLVPLRDQEILHGNYPKDKVLQLTDLCQSEFFFTAYKSEILKLFEIKIETNSIAKKYLDMIESKGASVAIHIRQGDLTRVKNRTIEISFHRDAMINMSKLIQSRSNISKPSFFVFSDDVEYAKTKLLYPKNATLARNLQQFEVHFVTGTSSIQDFFLMSKCNHDIIPCSTFSWWASYLNKNPNKIIIAAHYFPKMFNDADYRNDLYKYFYYPLKWLTVDAPFN